jgi:alpha-beta hydrolase superfamily lysophospholipase
LFSGSEDPVGQQLGGLHVLIDRYQDAGLHDVSFDFYPGGRHEMLNEINRRDVQTSLLGWISQLVEKWTANVTAVHLYTNFNATEK